MKAVLILSGGIDSSTLGYLLKSQGYNDLICVSFNYGQKNLIEIEYAKKIAKYLLSEHRIIDVTFMKEILKGCGLTDDLVNISHNTSPKSTVVPNRNTIFLSVAWAIACIEKADVLAYGAQCGDHFSYPDTRPDYFESINSTLQLGTIGSRKESLKLIAPLLLKSKSEVIKIGYDLGVPFLETYSCYQGSAFHCGVCSTCISRKEGFIEAQVTDLTVYEVL